MKNPLLDTSTLPRFEEISPDHTVPAIQQLIGQHRQRLDALLEQDMEHSFQSLVAPLEEMSHELNRVWSPVNHLQSVVDDDGWRTAYTNALPLLTDHSTELSQDSRLQQAFAAVEQSLPGDASDAMRSVVAQALRDFRLAGVALPDEQKREFRKIMQALAKAQAAFEHNIQDDAKNWSCHVDDENVVAGIPASSLDRARRDADEAGLTGWLFKLDYPSYHAVITHCENRELRRHFYRAWSTRASDEGNPEYDNGHLIQKILSLRHRAARMVGFPDFAEYSLATKMAGHTGEVLEFLHELAARSRPTAESEIAEVQSIAGHELEPWDVPFYTEKLKQHKYSISNEELRQYFPADRVLAGLFKLAEMLYGIRLQPNNNVQVWHPGIAYFDVCDEHGSSIGGFYTDLFARKGKRNGAWIDECIVRKKLNGDTVLPVGYLVCNFAPPSEDGVSLLTHDDVVTTFHEFGHMMHHLLTAIDFPSVAGINGVPWDAVELPSQFMENFAWNYEVLASASGHHETGETLPRDLYDKLYASRNLGAGLAMMRQLEFALFDFRLHAEYDPQQQTDPVALLREVREKVSLISHPDYNRLPHSFSHIFAGGYAAGYYSYKWAEVLAADAFAAFEESGIFNRKTADRFRKEILEVGGTKDFMEAFVSFRGRKPTMDALLLQCGIISEAA